MMKYITFIILFFGLLNFANAQQEPAKQMPNFNFVTTNNTPYGTKDLNATKKTLIVFFDATCSHCQTTGKFFNERLNDLKPYNVLFVTMDENKAIDYYTKNFAPAIVNNVDITILRDTAYYFVPNFQPKRYPGIFVYGSKKNLLFYTNDEKELEKVMVVLKKKED
ncbi:peroxiredoxin family protein [Pedobacter alpinus]|uniref:Peroxiredoxin family protein n=1 Tax=Pedobacter alpinus TaxID=1590643 RepID=A0ABW5TNK0_9SPHI